jgi:hypothetical protein
VLKTIENKKTKSKQNLMYKTKLNLLPLLLVLILSLDSCQAIGAIFKAGVWVGIVIVVIVLVIIFWLIRKFSK